jgi:phosphoenolpyruvate synthase/pyruvate phosphate dikinase
MNIVQLDSDQALALKEVGSKAVGLSKLNRLGFTTPPGFVVTVSAFRVFLENAGLSARIASLAECSEGNELERLLQDIRANISVAPWPTNVQESISVAYRTLSGEVAVRSSGIAEDGEQSTFAGAYTSLLNRTGEEDVLAAVRDCWSSAFSPRVVAYRLQHQLMRANWLMGVIVQTMIYADKGGVMFTRDPFEDNNAVLIEVVTGGCYKIVSGTPAELSVWVDRTTRQSRYIIQPPLNSKHFGTGATGVLSGSSQESPRLLRKKEISDLVETGLRLEEALGRPQDVEWDIADGKLVLLQTRPLTARNFGNKLPR